MVKQKSLGCRARRLGFWRIEIRCGWSRVPKRGRGVVLSGQGEMSIKVQISDFILRAVGDHQRIWKSKEHDYTCVFKNMTLATVLKKVGQRQNGSKENSQEECGQSGRGAGIGLKRGCSRGMERSSGSLSIYPSIPPPTVILMLYKIQLFAQFFRASGTTSSIF